MRKRFLIPLLIALSLPTSVNANIFGKYGSSYEANIACQNWLWKNKTKIFRCKKDPDTKQILGLNEAFKVKKRFKY